MFFKCVQQMVQRKVCSHHTYKKYVHKGGTFLGFGNEKKIVVHH